MSSRHNPAALDAIFLVAVLAAGAAQARVAAPEGANALARMPAPSVDEPVAPHNLLSIEGGQDASNVTLKIGGQLNDITGGADGGEAIGKFATYGLALSAPLDKGQDFTRPLTQDGLTNAAALKLELSQLVVPQADYGPGATTRQHNEAIAARVLIYRGVFGKVSRKTYTAYDPLTLAKDDLSRTSWRGGAFYALIGGSLGWSATVQYAHEETFKEADTRAVCQAGAGPFLTCAAGPIGPLTRSRKDIFSLEGRRSWGPKILGEITPRFGIAPKIAYDAKHDDWAVGLPVYLFGNSGGLTGGVRVDWDSRKDRDLLVGVFLTKTFSIAEGL